MTSIDTITIRKATVRDANSILDCLRSAFEPYNRCYTAVALEDTVLTPESVLRRLDEMVIFVALDHSGLVVGTVACNVIAQAEGHLRGMAVRPECQAHGIADQLLASAEAELMQQQCSRISLDTTEPLQRAMRFYEKHGFRRSGRVGDFFGMPLIEYVKVLTSNG